MSDITQSGGVPAINAAGRRAQRAAGGKARNGWASGKAASYAAVAALLLCFMDGAPARAQYGVAGGVTNGADSIAIGNNLSDSPYAAGTNSIAIGGGLGAAAYGSGDVAVGNSATTGVEGDSTNLNNTAIGGQAKATGTNSTATGYGATATGEKSSAYGWGATASGANATALGFNTQATGVNAVAAGIGATASGNYSVAIGTNNSGVATAAGVNGIAIGGHSSAGFAGGVALGAGAVAANANDVALGTGSLTAAPNTGIFDMTGGTAAGTSPTSVVSIGASQSTGLVQSAGSGAWERQIQNVAAGVLSATSTDAVNGSQLYSVAAAGNATGTSVAAALGGGSTYTPGSGVSAPSYAVYGSTQTSVGGAVAALQTLSPVQYSDSSGNPTPQVRGDNVTLVGTGGPVLLHNVAAGIAPTDAVNVSQLQSAMPGAWQTPTSNTFVFNNTASGGGEVTLSNVAPGAISATSTQAINGSQLYAVNQSINRLQNQVNSNFNELSGGIASAMALGMMRFDDRAGKFSAGVGVAGFDQQMGFAAGAGYTSLDQNWRFTGGVTFSPTANKMDVGGGASAVYTFN